MRRSIMVPLAAGVALPLAACGSGTEGNSTATAATEAAPANDTAGVTREEVTPATPAVAPMEQAAALQSQPGPGGGQVDLMKAAVTGDILTATFRCSGPEAISYQSFDASKMSMIDDATSQRITVLKDNDGNWLASDPKGNMSVQCGKTPGVFWAKFPAPPVTSATVSINLPATGPFDGVPVTR